MTAKIKLNAASGGGSVSLQAPSSSANNRVFTLPDSADATLSTVNGVTEADNWVLTTTYTASSGTDTTDPIASNLARSSFTGASYLGTGMTQSSGIFTFPSTGFWLVTAQFTINVQSNRAEELAQVFIKFTSDGTNYVDASSGYTFGEDYSSSRYSNIAISSLLDITNVSTHKIRFKTIMSNTTRVIGGTSPEYTAFRFIRLGDT